MPRTVASDITARMIGQEVRRARLEAGLKQTDVGERLQASATYIANIEAGRVNLTIGQLTRVAAALGADLQVSLPLVDIAPAQVEEPALG
jgi:transcriptional regulator with XRE-family HTH domain